MVCLGGVISDNSILPVCKDLPDYGTPCIRVGVPVKGYSGTSAADIVENKQMSFTSFSTFVAEKYLKM